MLRVADSGRGIPETELEVIDAGRETPWSHASGIGLWLVKWWADRADVRLEFETGDRGTVVTLEFDHAPVGDGPPSRHTRDSYRNDEMEER